MSEIQFQEMRPADLDEVLAMERRIFHDPWSKDSFASEITGDTIHWPEVARYAGKLIGYVVVWFVLDEAHIANLAVDPSWRRQGLGTRFINKVIEEGRGRGTRRIDLEVRVSNQEAIGLYIHLGFRPVGVRKGYYADNREDALLMRLSLCRDQNQQTEEDADCPGSEK